MTFSEFNVLAKAMKAMWPDPKFLPDSYTMELWFKLLGDLDYQAASVAVEEIMMTQRFAPMPADIRAAVARRTPEIRSIKTADEAWADVMMALRNGIYGYNDEFEKLDSASQKAIGSAEMLRTMASDEDFNLGVSKSNFIRSYNAAIDRQKTETKLPERMRLSGIDGKSVIPVILNGEQIGLIDKR